MYSFTEGLNISKNTLKALAKLELEARVTLIEDKVTPDVATVFDVEEQAGTRVNVAINKKVRK